VKPAYTGIQMTIERYVINVQRDAGYRLYECRERVYSEGRLDKDEHPGKSGDRHSKNHNDKYGDLFSTHIDFIITEMIERERNNIEY
jgi:hypothetical protein